VFENKIVSKVKLFYRKCLTASAAFALFFYPVRLMAYEGMESDDSEKKVGSSMGIDVRPNYAFSSYRDDLLKSQLNMDDADKTRFASSFHLKYSFSYGPSTDAGRFYPGAYQGVGVGVNGFGNKAGLGIPVSVYVFQGAPVWRLGEGLSLGYEWNFGASMGWKTCNGYDAHSNLIVGSRVNAYINLGVMMDWEITDHLSMNAGIDLTHFSNGNTSYPNPGVNLAGVRVGMKYCFGRRFRTHEYRKDTTSLKHKVSYDVMAYGALRKRVYRGGEDPVLLNGHFPVAGLNFAVMRDFNKIFRAGLSADFQWDESTNLEKYHGEGSTAEDLRFYRPPFFSQVCYGLSARAELVMPVFSVNLGIGYNFIGPVESRASYQMANLKVYVTPGLYLNVGYQLLNFSRQNNLMLGIGYTFNSNRSSGTTIMNAF